MNISQRIRSLRKETKMTLRELSETSAVALATLSRIETGKMTGTIESHRAIARALGRSLSELYADTETENRPVEHQTPENRTDVFLHNDKASYNMLTNSVLSKKMMPVMLKVSPAGKSTKEELPKGTEKFIYVLKGGLSITVNSKTITLKKGETLYFDASTNHYYKNPGTEETRALCVITPPAL